jgi:hypothetical protein
MIFLCSSDQKVDGIALPGGNLLIEVAFNWNFPGTTMLGAVNQRELKREISDPVMW